MVGAYQKWIYERKIHTLVSENAFILSSCLIAYLSCTRKSRSETCYLQEFEGIAVIYPGLLLKSSAYSDS